MKQDSWQKVAQNLNAIKPDLFSIKFECPTCLEMVNSGIVVLPDEDPCQQELYSSCNACEHYHQIIVSKEQGNYSIKIKDVPIEKMFFRVESVPEESSYLFNLITREVNFHQNFQDSIKSIKVLYDLQANEEDRKVLNNMLFVNVITVMETYLSDAFINSVLNNRSFVRKMIETTPEFQKEKFQLSEIYNKITSVEEKVSKYLLDTIYHKLTKVTQMYKTVLDVEFPKDMSTIYQSVLIRHDLVHRNGKMKNGENRDIKKTDLINLIEEVERFISHVDQQVSIINRL